MIHFKWQFTKKSTAVLLTAAFVFALFFSFGPVNARQNTAESRTMNVLVIGIDPVITTPENKKMYASEYLGFSLTDSVESLQEEIEAGTNETIKINITDTTRLEEFPTYDGYKSMTEEQFHILFPYDNVSKKGEWYGWWERDAAQHVLEEGVDRFHFDYDYFIKKMDLVKQRNEGKFDMVWVYSIDPSSMYETCMVGRNAVRINGTPYIADCDDFVLAGLTFSRSDGAIESICHSCEAMLNYTYKVTDEMYNAKFSFDDYDELSSWQKFYYNKHKGADGKEVYGVGQVHFSPNSMDNYEWKNDTPVYSYYDQFTTTYPDIDPAKAITFTASSAYMDNELYSKYPTVNEQHHVWWLNCMPHFKGRDSEGYSLNWFDYGFSTEYTSGIDGLAEYKDNCIEMTSGDKIEGLKLLRFLNGTENTEIITADSDHAFVTVRGDCIEYSPAGNVLAKAEGTADIEIKVDGFSLIYKVNVNKKEENVTEENATENKTTEDKTTEDKTTEGKTESLTPAPQKEEGLKIGDTINIKNGKYTVISTSELSYDGPVKKKASVKIPDTLTINNKVYKVTVIKDKAFYKDKKLKKLVIGKNVTKIGKRAFKGCNKLKKITIKSKKMSFGKDCFKGIYKKAVFKVPKSKKKEYNKNLIKKAKAPKRIKVKK